MRNSLEIEIAEKRVNHYIHRAGDDLKWYKGYIS